METLDLQEFVYTKINKIASFLPLLSSGTDSEFLEIAITLKELTEKDNLPKNFITTAKRGFDLVDGIMTEETDFADGMEKLNECISRLSTITAEIKNEDEDSQKIEENDEDDLLEKFGKSQSEVLDELENAAIAFENNDEHSIGIIKRILHTWKGEFGVLGLRGYSNLMHDMEGLIENNNISTDILLKLKDFILDKCLGLATGNYDDLPDKQRELFIKNNMQKDKDDELEKTELKSNEIQDKNDADQSLIADFISESMEHIDMMNPLLLELETDPSNIDHINSVFRGCHTIKGVSGFLNLKILQELAHATENLMDQARSQRIVLEPGHLDLLFSAVDSMTEYLSNLKCCELGGNIENPENVFEIIERLKLPDPNTIIVSPSSKKTGEILVECGQVKIDDVQKAVEKQKEGDVRNIGQILVEENKIPAREVGKALASQQAAKKAATIEESIRVPVDRLDKLIDYIGEAVIAQSMVFGDNAISDIDNSNLQKKISNAGIIMHQIQELSMSLRMVSLKQTFQKMGRIVRDISKKTGKPVEFLMDGEDTELDKTVIEHIGDPLMHMVRNSVDHGLENTEDRKSAGKDIKGKVTLKAFHKAGNVVIQIIDDGRGLDPEVLMKKALEKGIADPDKEYTEHEIYRFIFAPGFSTAKEITDISGRGVGMDVVIKNIQKLRGSVDIESEQDVGTTFSIRLPLTLAIIDGMLVRVKGEVFIIPMLSIIESVQVKDDLIETVLGEGEIVKLRGETMPLIRLSRLLNLEGEEEKENQVIMVVEDMTGARIGLLVDKIIGQQQVVIKNLGNSMGELKGVSGGAIMNDGTVSLILDVGEIVKLSLM